MTEERETRFSRQAPLLGEEGMRSMTFSTVLIHGLNGVGVEIGISFLFFSFLFYRIFHLEIT
jgi:tRNA A37 threonylcarbamoyladenosine dehydratase